MGIYKFLIILELLHIFVFYFTTDDKNQKIYKVILSKLLMEEKLTEEQLKILKENDVLKKLLDIIQNQERDIAQLRKKQEEGENAMNGEFSKRLDMILATKVKENIDLILKEYQL